MPDFSHLDDDGSVRMVDVGDKPVTRREARASGRVAMSPSTLAALKGQALPKGDVLATARVAAILAAKRTPELIPLAHPLALTKIDVDFAFDDDASAIDVEVTVRCDGKTGVEIEAMTACSIACLTIYDMCKSVEKGIVIETIRLRSKSGGASGDYSSDGS